MINFWVPPAFILIIGALIIPFLNGRARKVFILAVPVVAFINVLLMSKGIHYTLSFHEYKLIFARVDKLSLVFSYIFTIAAFIGALFSSHLKERTEIVAAFLYVAGALGVVFAGDFLTLFIFWELMAVSSTYVIWVRGTKKAISAGFRYFIVHMAGGLILFSGIVLYAAQTGSTAFSHIELSTLPTYLLLIGFGLNAAIPPLSAWLSDAYPESTVTGAVFLSAFTTKTAVYVLIRGFAGTELLILAGAIMAFYGVVFAVLANDIRRILAYHIISQVGFMVAATGIGTPLAINGAVAHAFAHILYKGLLFMGAGAVLHTTGKSKLNELGGLYKYMPITFALYMIGAVSISGFPFFSGFVSKSLEISAAAEEHLTLIWILLTVSSVGTFLHTGLKLPWFTWLGKDSGLKAKEPPKNMLIAMGVAATFCVLIGLFPSALYSLLPHNVHYVPYTFSHVTWSYQYLLFTAIGFFLLLKHLAGKPYIVMDTDWFYRKPRRIFELVPKAFSDFNNWVEVKIERIPYYLSLTKKPLTSITNFLSDVLFVIWVDMWLFRPAGKLNLKIDKDYDPHLEKNILFKPFYWLINSLDNLGNRMAKTLSYLDSTVVDKTAESISDAMFSQKEIISGHKLSSFATLFDKIIVDGAVIGIAKIIFFLGDRVRKIQSGLVQNYALIIVFAIAFMIFTLSIKGGLK